MSMKCLLKHRQSHVWIKKHCRRILWGPLYCTFSPNSAFFHIKIFSWLYLSDRWTAGHRKTEVMNMAWSREWCKSFPSVTFHYLEGCGQPAWPRPRFYTGADRGRGLSWFAGRQDIYKGKDKNHVRRSDGLAHENTDDIHKYPEPLIQLHFSVKIQKE